MTTDWTSAWEKSLELATAWLTGVGKVQEATLMATTRNLQLMANTYARLWGQPAEDLLPADKRFKDDAWQENLALDIMKQAYLTTAEWMADMTDGLEELSPELHKRARFWTQQFTDAMSPTNFAATNPAVLKETVRTGGTNLMQGMENLITDLQKGRVSLVPDASFVVGEDLAITPGKVVYRNPLIELIQYTPTTKRVREIPILSIPPWVNKYYVMDMRPDNSMYKYLVDAGFTLFTISWKNPDDSVPHLEWADYMEMGVMDALRVVKAITGSEKVNTIGYCLGGIVQQTTLAYMAAQGDNTVNSATFFATHQDFTDVGDIGVFLSKPEVHFLEWLMKASGGYLDSRNLGATFSMLRANDLLWHYVVNNYLLGKEPPAFDLLYWNSDGTRVPSKVHSFLLRELFLEDKLQDPDAIEIRGVGIDTQRIKVPTYAVVCERDHIVPWRGASKIRQMMGGPVRLILAESGHIAGIINHPDRKRRGYWLNNARNARTLDPDEWLATATKHEGSWWMDWVPWLKKHSGKLGALPPLGNDEFPPIMDAPGTYVLEE